MPSPLPKRRPDRPGSSSTSGGRGAVIAVGVTASVLAAFAIGVLVGRSQRPAPAEVTEVPARSADKEETASGPEIEMIRPDGSEPKGATETETEDARGADSESPPPTEEAPPSPTNESEQAAAPPSPARSADKPEPREASPSRTAGNYTVQVAAFRDRESAERLSLRLESKGFDAYVQRSDVNGKGVWYRVRVGAFDDKDAAKELARRVQSREGRSAYVTLR